MPDMAQAIVHPPPIRWIIGKVSAITGDTVTMDHDGGLIYEVGVLDQYIPVVGDVVHAIAWSENGMLIIGSNNQPLVPRVPPLPPGSPVTVTTGAPSTYTISTGSWAVGVALQGPDTVGCWFYPTVVALGGTGGSLGGVVLASFTISLSGTVGSPVELVLHNTATGAGALVLLPDSSWRTTLTTSPMAVELPMEWGQRLIAGEALGIGVGGGNYTGVFTGSTATLIFTPL